jgi:hypothetical protein
MASSGNFGTWNPLNVGSGGSTSLTVGNTNAVMTGADPRTTGTVGGVISDTDGYYFETVATSTGSGALTLGIVNEDRHNQCMAGQIHSRSGSFMWRGYSSGQFFVETSTNTSYGTFADGDVIGWFVKNSKLYVKKNNSDVVGDVVNTSAGIDISGGFFFPAVSRTVGGGAQTSSILRTDSDDWSYSPPEGFKGLTSKDMLISSDIDPAGDDGADDNPTKHFNTVLFDGNGSSNAVTGLGFQPDLIWGFTRSGSQSKRVVDSTRGGSERLYSDLGSAASTGTATISSFDSDGFTATGGAFNNDSGKTCGAWCWKANGGTTTSFSAGGNQLAGTYQANTKSKFSIITYTGSGSANSEVLHGLGATPNFIIFKARNDTHWWGVYHKSGGTVNTGYDSLLYLNSDNALASGQAVNIVPDSTKIVMSGNEQINRSSSYNYVMYAWADVEGMQKFGTYEGNANADGAFVYTGFRPRMLFTKRTENAGGWRVRDTARDTYNASTKISWWDSSSIEYSNSDYSIDILSNGFKLRTSSNDFNASEKWIYGAWGDVPFKYNNTF